MPSAILFDIYGTLADHAKSDTEAMTLLRQIVTRAGIRVSDQAMNAAEAFAVDAFAPNLFEAIIFKLVNRDSTLGLKCTAEFRKQFKPKFTAIAGAKGFLAQLRQRRLKLALVNRLSAEDADALAKAGLLELLDFKGLPAAMKIDMPDMRVLEFVLGNLGLAPTDCVLVGSRLDNHIRPGNELRMKTVLLKVGKHGTRQMPRDLKDVPGYEIARLEDLELALAEMG